MRSACGSLLLRANAVTEISGLQSIFCKQWVVSNAISNEATVSGKACRLAPVAIGELNLSELYVARPTFALSRNLSSGQIVRGLNPGCAPENRQLTGPLEAAAPGSGLSLR